MTRYIVFEPPAPGTASQEALHGATDGARFVRDAFAGWAVLVPFLWLFRHGLVLSGAVVLALWAGLGALGRLPGFGLAGSTLPLLLGALVALEGPSLKAATFRRRQWREAAVVEAVDEEEAAILYYAGGTALPDEVPASAGVGVANIGVAGAARGRPPAAAARSLLDPPRAR